ncbi:MAG: PEP-CTERM sorting domain-containing protein [Casimicrobiaceae bacterium]
MNVAKLHRWSVTAIVALTCAVGAAGSANGALMAYICDDALCTGGGDTIVTDQGAGDNFPGSAFVGQINEGALSINGFTIATNVSQSKPLIGAAASPQLDLSFSATTADTASHTIWLYLSDTGFTADGVVNLTFGGNQGSGNTVSAGVWGGTSNTNFNLSNLLASIGPTGVSPFALSTVGLLTATTNPFGLTLGVTITRNTPGTTAGGLNVILSAPPVTVPEPGTTLLLAIGAIALVISRGRRGARG